MADEIVCRPRSASPDVPAARGGVLVHLEVVQGHAEVAQDGVAELLELAQRLVLQLAHLLVVLDLQPPSGKDQEIKTKCNNKHRGERAAGLVQALATASVGRRSLGMSLTFYR